MKMMNALDPGFREKLEEVTVGRLRQGASEDALLMQLMRRLERHEAEALLARAAARVLPHERLSAAPRHRMNGLEKALTWVIFAWVALLFFQNIGIISAVSDYILPFADGLGARLVVLAVANLILLLLAGGYYVATPGRRAAVVLGAAILFAFPLSPLLAAPIRGEPPPWGVLVSLSAAFSYAAVILIAWLHRRRHIRSLAPAPTVDVFG